MASPIRINYLYFGVLFLIFSLVHCMHIQLIEYGSWKVKILFLFYAIGQSLLEVGFLVLLGAWIGTWKKRYQWIFVALTLLLLLLHLIDFPLARMMDLSVWQAWKLIIKETWENFIEMLYATHIRMLTWIGIGIGCLLFLILGLITYGLSGKRSISLSMRSYMYTLAIFPLAMLLCDCLFLPSFPVSLWRTYEKALPWKRTLVSAKEHTLSLSAHLKPMLSEEATLESISQLTSPVSMRLIAEKKRLPKSIRDNPIFFFLLWRASAEIISRMRLLHIWLIWKESVLQLWRILQMPMQHSFLGFLHFMGNFLFILPRLKSENGALAVQRFIYLKKWAIALRFFPQRAFLIIRWMS